MFHPDPSGLLRLYPFNELIACLLWRTAGQATAFYTFYRITNTNNYCSFLTVGCLDKWILNCTFIFEFMLEKIGSILLFCFGVYSIIIGIFTNRKVWMSSYKDNIETSSFAPYYNKLTNILLGLLTVAVGWKLLHN